MLATAGFKVVEAALDLRSQKLATVKHDLRALEL